MRVNECFDDNGQRIPIQQGKVFSNLECCSSTIVSCSQQGWLIEWFEPAFLIADPKTGQLLREHLRQKRGWHRIKEEDRALRTPLSTSQLLGRAGRAGSHIGALCEAIHSRQGQVGVRRIQGVLSVGV